MKTKLGAFHWKAKAATIATYFFDSKYEHNFILFESFACVIYHFKMLKKQTKNGVQIEKNNDFKVLMATMVYAWTWNSMKFLFFLCLSLFGKNFHSNWVVTRDTWYISKIEKPNRKMQSLWLHIFRIFI